MNENQIDNHPTKPSFKEAKRRHDLYFKGCALRTISSIAGVSLTRSEEDCWLNEQEKQDETNRAITDPDQVLKNRNIQETLHNLSFNAIDRLVHFYKSLASDTSTPVGKSLSKLEAKWGVLTPQMITQFHFLGAKVAVLEGGTDLDGHIYHVAPTMNGELISKSDGDKKVNLDKDQYLCIVFNPKKRK